MHTRRPLAPSVSADTKKRPCSVESLTLEPLDDIEFKNTFTKECNKPLGGFSAGSVTEDSSNNSSEPCRNSVHSSTTPITPIQSVLNKGSVLPHAPSSNSPVSSNSRSCSAKRNVAEEKCMTGPEIESYKALLKKSTRKNKKTPKFQQQHSKESLASYKDMVDIQYRGARRKNKLLSFPQYPQDTPEDIQVRTFESNEKRRIKK